MSSTSKASKDVLINDEVLNSLLKLMSNQLPAVRQGALVELIKFLNAKTDLSKQDVREVSKRMLPAPRPMVAVTSQPKKAPPKKEKKVRTLDVRIVALQEQHGPANRGIGSDYAKAMIALRAVIKAEKSAKKQTQA